jgi:hypothetical protein
MANFTVLTAVVTSGMKDQVVEWQPISSVQIAVSGLTAPHLDWTL